MTAYYQMSEDQEFQLYQVNHAMGAVVNMMDGIPADRTLTLSSQEVSALLSILRDKLPNPKDMPFKIE
jgi:hypothetical protein